MPGFATIKIPWRPSYLLWALIGGGAAAANVPHYLPDDDPAPAGIEFRIDALERLSSIEARLSGNEGDIRDIRDIRISTDKVKRRGEKIDGLQFDDGPEPSEVLEPLRPKVVGE